MPLANSGQLKKIKDLAKSGNAEAQAWLQGKSKGAYSCLSILKKHGDFDAAQALSRLQSGEQKRRKREKQQAGTLNGGTTTTEDDQAEDTIAVDSQATNNRVGVPVSVSASEAGSESTPQAAVKETTQSSRKRPIEAIELGSDEEEASSRWGRKSASLPKQDASAGRDREAGEQQLYGSNARGGAGRTASFREREIDLELEMLEIQQRKRMLRLERLRLEQHNT
ncbi:hypothetical protein LTR37_009176 [Vermiconidia calcicola]|uniref:Uncharacterized protein n=1 Tax=Vermiconidia calcicola TaxID=1690605 RepID=A0ACC3N8R5_9PEZI|nr:hypothetical protein LTR37_009176 [Vermiconidia calcicola]